MFAAKLIGPKDSVVLLQPGKDVVLGRGVGPIPASDKRCSRQSVQVRYDNELNIVNVTQIGVNPGIIYHGSNHEAYMAKDASYTLSNGQKFTVLMHDYEFTVSLPTPNVTTVEPQKQEQTIQKNNVKNPLMDWMDTDSPEQPSTSKQDSSVVVQQLSKPAPPANPVKPKPLCKYGINCYRKNKDHFLEYSHPHLETQSKSNAKELKEIPNESTNNSATSNSIDSKEAITTINTTNSSVQVQLTAQNSGQTKTDLHSASNSAQSVSPENSNMTSTNNSNTSNINSNVSGHLPSDNFDKSKSTLSEPVSASSTSTSSVSEPVSAPAPVTSKPHQRPSPLDIMDDEEAYLPPPSKKKKFFEPKKSEVTLSTPQTSFASKPQTESKPSSSTNSAMDWLDTQDEHMKNESVVKTSIAASIKTEAISQPATKIEKSPAITASRNVSSSSIERPEKTIKPCSITSFTNLESLLRSLAPSTRSRALVIPTLGTSARKFSEQETADLLVNLLTQFVDSLPQSSNIKLYYLPDGHVSAACFRRKLPIDAASNDRIEMLPPGTNIVDLLPLGNQEQIILVNDSNWRFKGNGGPNSLNVRLNTAAGPALSSDSKALFNVGQSGFAYPVPIRDESPLKIAHPAVTHVIQVVAPTNEPEQEPGKIPPNQLLERCYLSILGSFMQIN